MIRRQFGAMLGAIARLVGVPRQSAGRVPQANAWEEPNPGKSRSGAHHVSPTARAKRKKRRQMARESRRRNR